MLERKGRAQAAVSGWILRRVPGHGKFSYGTQFSFLRGSRSLHPEAGAWVGECCGFALAVRSFSGSAQVFCFRDVWMHVPRGYSTMGTLNLRPLSHDRDSSVR